MGESILASLSLPPSGRVLSKQATGVQKSTTDRSDDTQTRDQTPFITPVLGIISNEDVPAMISSKKRTLGGDGVTAENLKFTVVKERQNCKDDGGKEGREVEEEERRCSKGSSGLKRKQPDKSESDEEVEVFSMIRSSEEISKGLRDAASRQSTNESEEDGAQMVRDEGCNQAILATCMAQMGVKSLRLPEDPALCSIFVSCVCRQPRVVLDKLSEASAASGSGKGEKSSSKNVQDQKRKSPVKASAHKRKSKQHQKPDSDFPDLDDKE